MPVRVSTTAAIFSEYWCWKSVSLAIPLAILYDPDEDKVNNGFTCKKYLDAVSITNL